MSTFLRPQVVTQSREALSRAVRQAIQALIPTLLIVAAGSTKGIDVAAVATLAGVTALISVLKSAATLKASLSDPVWLQMVDRAVTAFAGTAVGLFTIDGVIPSTQIDWYAAWVASWGSALLSVAMFYTNPPVGAASRDQLGHAR